MAADPLAQSPVYEGAAAVRPRRRTPVGVGLAVALGFLLWGATAGGVFLINRDPAVDIAILIVLWFSVTMVIVMLSVEATRRPYSLHTMHLLSCFLFLGAPPLFQYTNGYFPIGGPITLYATETLIAAFAILLWIVSYTVAYETHHHFARPYQKRGLGEFLARDVSPRRMRMMLILAITTILYLGVVVGLAGATSRGAAREATAAFVSSQGVGGGLIFFLVHQLLLRSVSFIAGVGACLTLARRGLTRDPLLFALLMVLALGIAFANNPLASQRIWLVTCLFGFIAPLVFKRMQTSAVIVLTSIGGITILPALSANRNAYSLGEWLESLDVLGLVSPFEFLTHSSDVDSLGMLSMCVRWTDQIGYQWGFQTLTGVFSWVPRAIWPSKSVGTGSLVSEAMGIEFTNLSAPLVAEPLVDFGLIGIIPFAAVIGVFVSKLDLLYWVPRDEKREGTRVIDVIYPFWLGLMVFFVRGDLLAATTFFLAFTAWIVPMGIFARPYSATRASGLDGIAASASPSWDGR